MHVKVKQEMLAFVHSSLMATLPGLQLYRACGYEGDVRVEYEINGGVKMEFVPMRKQIG